MWTRWSRRKVSRGGVGVAAAVPESARSETPGPCQERPPEAEAEGQDPLFEGGGSVLLRPAFWEKAGWGIALVAALV